jgi:S-adenosyl methyltransferase
VHNQICYDPLVLVHARALLTSTPQGACDYIDADLREPGEILAAAQTLDLSKPTAIMMLGILNFIVDTDQARTILRHLLGTVPPGSYISISHPPPRSMPSPRPSRSSSGIPAVPPRCACAPVRNCSCSSRGPNSSSRVSCRVRGGALASPDPARWWT